jgi:hypothetical protein
VNYLVVSVVVSVVFLTVVPPPSGVAGVVVVLVSTVVVVLLVVLPSLVCDVFVSVLFSVVPFWLSQPIVDMPSTAIKTAAKKSFIFTPFPKKLAAPLHQQDIPAQSCVFMGNLVESAGSPEPLAEMAGQPFGADSVANLPTMH